MQVKHNLRPRYAHMDSQTWNRDWGYSASNPNKPVAHPEWIHCVHPGNMRTLQDIIDAEGIDNADQPWNRVPGGS